MLEGIGLFLAILDFFDLTPRLEIWLDKLTERLGKFIDLFRAITYLTHIESCALIRRDVFAS